MHFVTFIRVSFRWSASRILHVCKKTFPFSTISILRIDYPWMFLSVTACLFLASCASKLSPTGGPKDEQPPVSTGSIPPDYSVHFKSKTITINFNEFIQLKEVQRQLIVSPLIDPFPEITVKRKSLKIRLPDTLKANTTYTMNFGEAIADIHEGNVARNFQYVFSTGSILDSLEVKGTVFRSENLKTEKDILVMLYGDSISNDSLPYQSLPSYFARTDSAGRFKIRNISPGVYKIFALKDGDNNYRFNRQDEAVAFRFNPVEAPDSNETELRMFVETPPFSVKKITQAYTGKIILAFSAPAPDLRLQPLNGDPHQPPWDILEQSELRDSCILWVSDTLIDSLNFIVFRGMDPVDTIHFKIPAPLKKATGSKAMKERRLQVVSNLSGGQLPPGQSFTLRFGFPVEDHDLSKIRLLEDSVLVRDPEYLFETSLKLSLKLNIPLKQGKRYDLYIPPGTLKAFNGYENDTVRISFRQMDETLFGSLTVQFTAPDIGFDYVLQLVDAEDRSVRKAIIKPRSKTEFSFLEPGSYRLKVIYDGNANKRWDTGKYREKLQPERVFYFRDPVTIRANWDMETEWTLTQ